MKYIFILISIFSILLLGSCKKEDITPPVIQLLGDSSMTINLGSNFVDPGAIANDDIDGDISDEIIISGTIDTNNEGIYFLQYNVEDMAGNQAIEKERKVKVLIF